MAAVLVAATAVTAIGLSPGGGSAGGPAARGAAATVPASPVPTPTVSVATDASARQVLGQGQAAGKEWAVVRQALPTALNEPKSMLLEAVSLEVAGARPVKALEWVPPGPVEGRLGPVYRIGISTSSGVSVMVADISTEVAKVTVRLADGTSVTGQFVAIGERALYGYAVAPLAAAVDPGTTGYSYTAYDAQGAVVGSGTVPAPSVAAK